MKIVGPDTRYMMQWRGEWHAVTNMLDSNRKETHDLMRAAIAVLFVEPNYWVTTLVSPGDVVERHDRDPLRREWDWID